MKKVVKGWNVKIDFIRIFSIFAVIVIHTSGACVVEIQDTNSYKWIIGNIFNSYSRWAVPVFIMISGYLLLNQEKVSETIQVFYKKRIFRIAIPILIWSIFYLAWDYMKVVIKTGSEPSFFLSFVQPLITGKPHYHMWFLFMIICLYALTPLIRKVIAILTEKELWVYTLIFLIIASMESFFPQDNIRPFFLDFFKYIPYYILGHLLFKVKSTNSRRTIAIIIFLLSGVIAAVGTKITVTSFGMDNLYFYNRLSITTILASISMFYLLININIHSYFDKAITIAPLTLGIYLVHPLFLEIGRYFGYKVELYNPLISIPLASIVTFLLSILLCLILLRIPYLNKIVK